MPPAPNQPRCPGEQAAAQIGERSKGQGRVAEEPEALTSQTVSLCHSTLQVSQMFSHN